MDYTTSYFPFSIIYTLWIPNDHMDLSQTPCVQVPVFSCHRGHVVSLDQSQALLRKFSVPAAESPFLDHQLPIKIGAFRFLPTGLQGLCFGYCFAGPLPLRSLTNGPLFMVHFGESLVIRLYSEIDHLHLSIEAQCVSHLLPLGDCHMGTRAVFQWHMNRYEDNHSLPMRITRGSHDNIFFNHIYLLCDCSIFNDNNLVGMSDCA